LSAAGRVLVVGASQERRVQKRADAAKKMLRWAVALRPGRLQRRVRCARRSGAGKARDARRRHPPRAGRAATLTIRACSIVLPRPPKLSGELPAALPVNLVQVIEEHPPAGATPVEWLLVTTLPIAEATDIGDIVDH